MTNKNTNTGNALYTTISSILGVNPEKVVKNTIIYSFPSPLDEVDPFMLYKAHHYDDTGLRNVPFIAQNTTILIVPPSVFPCCSPQRFPFNQPLLRQSA